MHYNIFALEIIIQQNPIQNYYYSNPFQESLKPTSEDILPL